MCYTLLDLKPPKNKSQHVWCFYRFLFFTLLMTGAGWTEEQVLVLGAGHLVPMNQPLSAVVTRFSQLRNLGMMELGFFDWYCVYIYIYVFKSVCVCVWVPFYPYHDFPTTRMIADCSCAWTSLGCMCICTEFFCTNIAYIFFCKVFCWAYQDGFNVCSMFCSSSFWQEHFFPGPYGFYQ